MFVAKTLHYLMLTFSKGLFYLIQMSIFLYSLYLQLQVWVISHVNQQAVEAGQAPGVSLTAGTPWEEVTHNKNALLCNININRAARKRQMRRQTASSKCAMMYILFKNNGFKVEMWMNKWINKENKTGTMMHASLLTWIQAESDV